MADGLALTFTQPLLLLGLLGLRLILPFLYLNRTQGTSLLDFHRCTSNFFLCGDDSVRVSGLISLLVAFFGGRQLGFSGCFGSLNVDLTAVGELLLETLVLLHDLPCKRFSSLTLTHRLFFGPALIMIAACKLLEPLLNFLVVRF